MGLIFYTRNPDGSDHDIMSIAYHTYSFELDSSVKALSDKNDKREENKEWQMLEQAKVAYPLLTPVLNHFQEKYVKQYIQDDEYKPLDEKTRKIFDTLGKSEG
jgi:hypothetical protein